MDMTVIGLTGPAGAGKSEGAKLLASALDLRIDEFARPLREIVAGLLDVSDEMWADRAWKEAPVPDLGVSPRRMMQTLGTEWGRELIHPDLWVRLLERRLIANNELDDNAPDWARFHGVVIPDVRFPNEVDWVHSQGGVVIRIERAGLAAVEAHASEAGVAADAVVQNDGTLVELMEALLAALQGGA